MATKTPVLPGSSPRSSACVSAASQSPGASSSLTSRTSRSTSAVMLLTDEITRRDNTAADNRAHEAGLDPTMRLEQWDKTSKVSFDTHAVGA